MNIKTNIKQKGKNFEEKNKNYGEFMTNLVLIIEIKEKISNTDVNSTRIVKSKKKESKCQRTKESLQRQPKKKSHVHFK